MSGFGSEPFGSGPFGRDDWSTDVLINTLPDIYAQSDQQIDGQFINMLTAMVPTFDTFVDKINKLYYLRDPLLCPVDTDFVDPVVILKVDDLGDGTSRVYLSLNANELAYTGVRPGFVLTDSSGNQFPILDVNQGDSSTDVPDPPLDPYTGNPSGKNLIVSNISLTNVEVIPQVSGPTFTTTSTNATVPANDVTQPTVLIVSPLDNGSNAPPYTLIVGGAPIAANLVTITWTESTSPQTGYINNIGNYSGDLTVGTSIDYNTGTITMVNSSGDAVDNLSISVTYTSSSLYDNNPITSPIINGSNTGPYTFTLPNVPLSAYEVTLIWTEATVVFRGGFSSTGVPFGNVQSGSTINFTTGQVSFENTSSAAVDENSLMVRFLPEFYPITADAEVTQENILAFLAQDYGVTIDRHEPETFQRSSVYNAYQLWDSKGTETGYEVLANMAGFNIEVERLYRINSFFGAQYISDSKPVYDQPGYYVNNENPILLGNIYPIPTGSNLGAFTITVNQQPVYTDVTADSQPRVQLKWTQGDIPYSVTWNSSTDSISGNTANIASYTQNPDTIVVTFNAGFAPDANSITISYYPLAYYTSLDPNTLIMDDVVLDELPLDEYCADTDFPMVPQTVDIVSVTEVDAEDGTKRWSLKADISSYNNAYLMFGTDGYLESAGEWIVNFVRLSATQFTFQILTNTTPSTVTGTYINWNVFKDIPAVVTDTPGITPGTTVSPAVNGSNLGAFTIQLSSPPVWTGDTNFTDHVVLNWTESSVAKTAYITGTSTVAGTNAANIASASINRTTGVLTITFNTGHAPGANSLTVTYRPVSDTTITGLSGNLTSLGIQYTGYTGVRYNLQITLRDVIAIGNVGQWMIIDSNGVQSWIESIALVSTGPNVYNLQFISGTVPATGPANIFYSCTPFTSCSYCPASVIRIVITPGTINDYSDLAEDVADGAAATRLFTRMQDLIPAHVRALTSYLVAGFSYTIP